MADTVNFLLTNYGVSAEIDTTPYGSERTWAVFGTGINNLTEALNEVVQNYSFIADHGYGSTFVTGMSPRITCSGVRVVGDPAQDYIFAAVRRYGLMAERNTNFRFSIANADGSIDQITVPCTLANVQSFGGASTDGSAVSVEINFNGKPTIAKIARTSNIVVSSVAGDGAGTTVVTATPTYPDASCKYVYAIGDTAPAATTGSVLTGWNDFDSGSTYTIASDKYITVAMVNLSSYIVVASGNAKIVSAV